MLTRKTLLAIAATAALGASALGTTDASAFGFHGGFRSFHSGYGSHWTFHPIWRHGVFRFGYQPYAHHYWGWLRYRPYWSGPYWYRPYWSWRYRWFGNYSRPFGYGVVGAGLAAASGGASMPISQPMQQSAQAPGNCLVKNYQQDGSVVFQDVCTRETAVGMAQTAGPAGPGAR